VDNVVEFKMTIPIGESRVWQAGTKAQEKVVTEAYATSKEAAANHYFLIPGDGSVIEWIEQCVLSNNRSKTCNQLHEMPPE
jgi:hypothetical protein